MSRSNTRARRSQWKTSVPTLATCTNRACGGFNAPHARLVHVARVGTLVFHCERRARVLLRDIFLFGTATIRSPCRYSLAGPGGFLPVRSLAVAGDESVPQSGPAKIQYLMGMARFQFVEPLAALHAQAGAIRTADRGQRQREDHLVTDQRFKVDQVVDQTLDLVGVRGRRGRRIR